MQNRIFQTSVATDKTQYTGNRAVELWVKLTNVSSVVGSYRVVDALEYEIKVREVRTRRVVWTWSKGQPSLTNLLVTLKPGEYRQHRELWDRRDDSGRPVPAGLYEVEATHAPQIQPARAQFYLVESGKPSEPAPTPIPKATLVGALRVERPMARPGETIPLTYTVTNQGKAPAALSFASGKQFDVEAPRLRWRLSEGQLYTQAFTSLRLGPQESRSYTGRLRVPNNAPEGVAELRASLTPVDDASSALATALLTIKR